jgi:hypothetical protein
MLRALALHYLTEIAADMHGLPGDRQRNGDAADRKLAVAQPPDVRPSPTERDGGEGHGVTATQVTRAAPSSLQAGDRNHSGVEIQSTNVPSPSKPRGGTDRGSDVARFGGVRPVREPSKAQKTADAAVWKSSAQTVLDTFMVDGRAIGDLTVGEVRKLGKQKGVEYFVMASIDAHYANATSNMRVRDIIKASDLEKMIAEAKESADVFGH